MKFIARTRVVLLSLSALASGCGAKTDVRGAFDDVEFPDAGRRGRIGSASCTPGTVVTIACGSRGLGRCSQDPVLLVCDGARTAPARCGLGGGTTLGENDDDTGLCPGLTVTCPSSGTLAIRARRFASEDDPVDCDWATREGT